VSFTALLDAHEPPASMVTVELGEAEADTELEVEGELLAEGLLVPPLLHAASPVTAATAATVAAAMPRRLPAPGLIVSVLNALMVDMLLCVFLCDKTASGAAYEPAG
jgi:hypothetical protein